MMVFDIAQHYGAFLDDGQKIHYEFCKVNYEVYRSDIINKEKTIQALWRGI